MNYCINRSTIIRAGVDVVIKKRSLVRKNDKILHQAIQKKNR